MHAKTLYSVNAPPQISAETTVRERRLPFKAVKRLSMRITQLASSHFRDSGSTANGSSIYEYCLSCLIAVMHRWKKKLQLQ